MEIAARREGQKTEVGARRSGPSFNLGLGDAKAPLHNTYRLLYICL